MMHGDVKWESEHKALMDAALDNDTQRIKELMNHHIQQTADALIGLFDGNGTLAVLPA
ncbi:hypothetical protein [Dickeya zeae]|uniref:hypothetical protein n=1 Tax=Dickeya zeae TaxID=204042 RepID=UPI00209720FB|nr:hypothetical protein [Dickeya zeae]MCO7262338.1 hypothetical protein [Dickeya zeae]